MPRNFNKYVFFFALSHLLIVLPLAFYLNVWADEASTLATTGSGFFQTFSLVHNEKQSPLYFLILGFWRVFNDSIFFARLFSIICSTFAIFLFYDLAKKLFKENAAIFMTAAFAFHPYLIWASLEIRVYSLVILLTILLTKLFYEMYFEGAAEERRTPLRQQIFFVAAAIFALYTNYYTGFLLFGNFVALLILKRWRSARNYFWLMTIVAAAILPLFWLIFSQFFDYKQSFHSPISLIAGLKIFWSYFINFILPTEFYTTGTITNISLFRLWFARLAVAAVIVIFIKKRIKPDEKILFIGVILGVINLFLLAVYLTAGSRIVEMRHAAVEFIFVLLFAGLILEKILPPKSVIFAAVLLAIFFGYSIFSLYPNLAKRGDWARAAAFIEQNEQPNQPIIVFRVYDVLALRAHYGGVNKILPDKKLFDFNLEDEQNTSLSFARQIEFVISTIPPDSEEIWLATGEDCETTESCLPLENFIKANYTVIKEKEFYLERIRLLRKNQ